MVVNVKKPFKTLAIRHNADDMRVAVFSIDDTPGQCVDPNYDAIKWSEFLVYGISDSDEEINKVFEDDFSSATKIGSIMGYYVSCALMMNLGYNPYMICDDESADLEAMCSVLMEYEDDFMDYTDDIYYIHEIELDSKYQGMGYEKTLLLQLPSIIVKMLQVLPTLLIYYPAPIMREEPERDLEAEAILMHRLRYNTQEIFKEKKTDNISLFPPIREVPEREINRYLGRRNPGDAVPEAHRNQALYKLYKSAGFQEIGQTGWLCKPIASIYSKDGMNY